MNKRDAPRFISTTFLILLLGLIMIYLGHDLLHQRSYAHMEARETAKRRINLARPIDQPRVGTSSSTTTPTPTTTTTTSVRRRLPWDEGQLNTIVDELLVETANELKKLESKPCDHDHDDGDDNHGGGSISSSKVLISPPLVEHPPLHPLGEPLGDVVVFRAYRSDPHTFMVVGLDNVALRRFRLESSTMPQLTQPLVQGCIWKSNSSSNHNTGTGTVVYQHGLASARVVNDSRGTLYDALVITCSFKDPVGLEGYGGDLYLNMSSLHKGLPSKLWQVFQEKDDEITSIQFEGPYPNLIAFCPPPIWGNLYSEPILEWIAYHNAITNGRAHFFLYDGGMSPTLVKALEPLVAKGKVSIVDFVGQQHYPSSLHGQHLAINDCLRRSQFVADWMAMWDLDEFLHAPPLEDFLAAKSSQVWISFGNWVWSPKYCLQEEDNGTRARRWNIERMGFRLKEPQCGQACHGNYGFRKFLANPRKVLLASVHMTLEPLWFGEVVNVSVAKLHHYRGLTTPIAQGMETSLGNSPSSVCSIKKDLLSTSASEAIDGWWWLDTQPLLAYSFARNFSSHNLSYVNSSPT